MPIVTVENSNWIDDPVKVNEFLMFVDICIPQIRDVEVRERVQSMRDWVSDRRVFSIKQEGWLAQLKRRFGVGEEDTEQVEKNFWTDIFPDYPSERPK